MVLARKKDYLKECISEDNCFLAVEVWNKFRIKSLVEYHDNCLKTDLLILAVFEKFINTCLEYHRLDPCHYLRSPGLSWDAMLKMAVIELELIKDMEKHLLIEKGREVIFLTLLKGKVKQVIDTRDHMILIDQAYNISYLDANNLYDWAMRQCLTVDLNG